MRAILDLLPIGIGVALVAVLVWFLLDRDIGLGKWLFAPLLLAHGAVHLMFVFPAPQAAPATAGGLDYPFDMARSWLITSAGLDAALLRLVGIGAIVVATVAFILAALATVGWLVPAEWWASLILAGATASSLVLVLFFSPALLLGFVVNAALWWLVLASVWNPVAGAAGGGGAV